MIIKKKRLNNIRDSRDIPESNEEIISSATENNSDIANEVVPDVLPENSSYAIPQEPQPVVNNTPQEVYEQQPSDESDLFDVDNIDFSQRQERRRGDRRRGFRRVDDRNLVSRAREEADSIREAALKEGYQAGLQQAKSDLQEFRESLTQFMNAPNDVYGYIAPDILEISVDIAKKIIKKEIEEDPQVLFNTIVDVLKTLSKDEAKITLQVNPSEANALKQAVPEILDTAGLNAKVIVLPDEEVSEGGCLVTTDNGVVDATIETRIDLITEALREL